MTPEQLASALSAGFSAADTDNNGMLTFEEAVAARPQLTRALFDEWDTNNDGNLTQAELDAVNRPVGCPLGKSTRDVTRALGDLFLLGIALLTLLGWSAASVKR